VTSTFVGVIYWPWPIFLPSWKTVTHKLFKILSRHGFCIKCFCDLDLWPSDLNIYQSSYQVEWLSLINVSRYWADMIFAFNPSMTLTFDLVTSKFVGVIYWPWPIFLQSTTTVTQKLFKILSGHDVANRRTDRRTDGQTPYHNMSEVSLQAYKKMKKNFN